MLTIYGIAIERGHVDAASAGVSPISSQLITAFLRC